MSTILIALSIILLLILISIIYYIYKNMKQEDVSEEDLDKVTLKIRDIRKRLGNVKRKRPKSIKIDLNEKSRI